MMTLMPWRKRGFLIPFTDVTVVLIGQNVIAVGFEPTPPERLEPKSSALDHSATLPVVVMVGSNRLFRSVLLFNHW